MCHINVDFLVWMNSIHKIPRKDIKMIDYWENSMMPRMRNVMKQLRESNAKLADIENSK